MAFERDPRMDRRRRVLRDSTNVDEIESTTRRSRSRAAETGDIDSEKRTAYSQDVRRTCQQRLVELIPVRRRSYSVAVMLSVMAPMVLLIAHYLVYVSTYSRWRGHPLALALDASHPHGIAAWLSSNLWLLCLVSTSLTFRLRKHKLDDYNGDYRLWFWLVATCLIGSLDSTTHVTTLFGEALNHWSQLNLGWSGVAVVQATLAVLIGMLGLRLCSELKSVPSSLMFWLIGLSAWAGSAVLGQSMFKIEMEVQFRIWLRVALWLGGLTSIWLASLTYLRSVYIDAQRRFLLRGRLATSVSSTLRERIVGSLPSMPKLRLRREAGSEETRTEESSAPRRRFGLPSFIRRRNPVVATTNVDEITTTKSNRTRTKLTEPAQPDTRQTIKSTTTTTQSTSSQPSTQPSIQPARPSVVARTPVATNVTASSSGVTNSDDRTTETVQTKKRGWLSSLIRRQREVGAPEYEKVDRTQKAEERKAAAEAKRNERAADLEAKNAQRLAARQAAADKKAADRQAYEENTGEKKRSWLPSLPKMPSIPRPRLPKISLPKLKMPSLRLPPPQADSSDASTDTSAKPTRALPSTNGPTASQMADEGGRPLSKAERKKLRRQQYDDDEGERRAA